MAALLCGVVDCANVQRRSDRDRLVGEVLAGIKRMEVGGGSNSSSTGSSSSRKRGGDEREEKDEWDDEDNDYFGGGGSGSRGRRRSSAGGAAAAAEEGEGDKAETFPYYAVKFAAVMTQARVRACCG